MKIGIDFHGVITKYPEFFHMVTMALVTIGCEVHIITGTEDNERFRIQLKEAGIWMTDIFSIVSEYKDLEWIEFRRDNNGDPWLEHKIWNEAKAKYCEEKQIDFHIDDSNVYGKYFTGHTKYIKVG